jgi:amino acid adenylation domain-containing protein
MGYNEQILIHRFLASAIKYPDRPALEFARYQFTYAQLLKKAHAYAREIASLKETSPVVAIMGHRTFDGFAGILGILLAGKGYLPLNPGFPPDRNRYILERSGTHTILTGGGYPEDVMNILSSSRMDYRVIEKASDALDGQDELDLAGVFDDPPGTGLAGLPVSVPRDIAYLLFTSGSTGKPKGVAVSNRNVTAYLDNITSLFHFTPEDRFTQTFDLTFDLSVHDLFVCWSAGACLCVPEDGTSFGLRPYMDQLKPTVWFSVPSVAVLMDRMRLLKENTFPWLRLSFFCGEALLYDTAISWKNAAPSSKIINLYGPTEATIAVGAYPLPEKAAEVKTQNGIVSIGKLFPGHQYILGDEEDNKGMLCLSGPQVVEGYFRDERMTNECFFETGTPSLFYNTGDLVLSDKEGDLFFLGRADSEVKISGYRVNLLEIDHVISSVSKVEQAATLYLEDPGGMKRLVSFIVMKDKEDDIPYILKHCRRQLPQYMVPEKIIFADALPLNPNGKTDRRALAEIFRNHYEQGNQGTTGHYS